MIGQADVFMKLPHFADELQKFVVAHQEIGYQIAPWVLMVVSVLALMLMQWPHLFFFWNFSKPQPAQLASPAEIKSRAESAEGMADDESAYMEGYEVIDYIADESAWGKMIAEAIAPHGGSHYQRLMALDEFRDRAQKGTVHVLGRLGGVGQHQEIPSTYWLSGGLDVNTTLRKQSSDTAAWIPQVAGVPIYRNVLISRADVYKAWPRRIINNLEQSVVDANLREYWIEKFSQEFKGCFPTNNIRNRAGIRIARLADSMPSELLQCRKEIIEHGFYRAIPGGGFNQFWRHLCKIQKWPSTHV